MPSIDIELKLPPTTIIDTPTEAEVLLTASEDLEAITVYSAVNFQFTGISFSSRIDVPDTNYARYALRSSLNPDHRIVVLLAYTPGGGSVDNTWTLQAGVPKVVSKFVYTAGILGNQTVIWDESIWTHRIYQWKNNQAIPLSGARVSGQTSVVSAITPPDLDGSGTYDRGDMEMYLLSIMPPLTPEQMATIMFYFDHKGESV